MSTLSVHKGSKVVMSLVVCRYPTRYVQPEFIKELRSNRPPVTIADGLAYMKTPGHFLPSIEERARQQRQSITTSLEKDSHASEIDQLLASEGIPSVDSDDQTIDGDKHSSIDNVNNESKNIQSDHEKTLWLIVKYKAAPSIWTFPFTHRRDSDSA